MRKPLLAFFLGSIFFFVVAEIFFRIGGAFFEKDMSAAGDKSTRFRILCLGNSHTYGAGVPEGSSYCHVLEGFFKRHRPDHKVAVVNAGMNNGNTSIILSRLDTLLSVGKPDLVLTMAGEPNIWNKTGFNEFQRAQEKKGDIDWEAFFSQSRVIRWFLLLPYLSKSREVARLGPDFEAYKVLSKFEEGHFYNLPAGEKARMAGVVERFLKNKEGQNLRTRFIFFYILASLNRDVDKIIYYLEKSIQSSGTNPNYFALRMLELWIPNEKDQARKKKLMELKRLASGHSLDEKQLRKEVHIAWEFDKPRTLEPATLATLEKVRKYTLFNMELTIFLTRHYFSVQQYEKGLSFLREILEMNPLSETDLGAFQFLNDVAEGDSYEENIRRIAAEIRKSYLEKFPAENLRFFRLKRNDLSQWIAFDLSRIDEKLRNTGAIPVFLTYHSLRNWPEEETINQTIRNFASGKDSYLLDLQVAFSKELSQHADEEGFFVQAFGPNDSHPNEKGHKLIARIIYDYLNNRSLLPRELSNLPGKDMYAYAWEEK